MKGFVATLGFSRSSYVVFSAQERQEDSFSGIEEAFYYFGGVPQEVLFDNTKAIILERDAGLTELKAKVRLNVLTVI